VYRTERFHNLGFQNVQPSYSSGTLKDNFKKETDPVKDYLLRYVDLLSPKTLVLRIKDSAELNQVHLNGHDTFINVNKINNVRKINEYLNRMNKCLPPGGVHICCVETLEQRRERFFNKYPAYIVYLYYFLDFIVNRVFPKLHLTRNLYNKLRNGNNRVISLPEVLGRLVFNGFEIIDTKQIYNLTYIITQKEKDPVSDQVPADGMLLKIKKIGKDGKIITLYKIRTMYTFSEYLQKYVYEQNHLKNGGKFKDDFRITGWGKFLRKYWIDELPMFYNVLKGEMKIVGLRPLTPHYLSLYNENIITKRSLLKPGLVPPFYVDMPGTIQEIMDSEEKYVDSYLKHPYKTDCIYFYKALRNILLRGARSS
jgi:hypothetical protein